MALVRRAANRDLESRSLLNQTYLFMRLTQGADSSGFFMSLPVAIASKLAPTEFGGAHRHCIPAQVYCGSELARDSGVSEPPPSQAGVQMKTISYGSPIRSRMTRGTSGAMPLAGSPLS